MAARVWNSAGGLRKRQTSTATPARPGSPADGSRVWPQLDEKFSHQIDQGQSYLLSRDALHLTANRCPPKSSIAKTGSFLAVATQLSSIRCVSLSLMDWFEPGNRPISVPHRREPWIAASGRRVRPRRLSACRGMLFFRRKRDLSWSASAVIERTCGRARLRLAFQHVDLSAHPARNGAIAQMLSLPTAFAAFALALAVTAAAAAAVASANRPAHSPRKV